MNVDTYRLQYMYRVYNACIQCAIHAKSVRYMTVIVTSFHHSFESIARKLIITAIGCVEISPKSCPTRRFLPTDLETFADVVQGYLAHKKLRPPRNLQ